MKLKMRSFNTFFAGTATILTFVSATPFGGPGRAYSPSGPDPSPAASPSDLPDCSICLTESTATYLVNGFATLLTAYNTNTANAILASGFTDTSDSINFIAGKPLGGVTFKSKAAFEAGQGSQPAIGFSILAIDAFTCNVIAFRWVATLGAYPVKGVNVIYASNLNNTDSGWQIETNYSEFNVGAWELDIGRTCG